MGKNLTTASTLHCYCHETCSRFAPNAQKTPSPSGAKIQVKRMLDGRLRRRGYFKEKKQCMK